MQENLLWPWKEILRALSIFFKCLWVLLPFAAIYTWNQWCYGFGTTSILFSELNTSRTSVNMWDLSVGKKFHVLDFLESWKSGLFDPSKWTLSKNHRRYRSGTTSILFSELNTSRTSVNLWDLSVGKKFTSTWKGQKVHFFRIPKNLKHEFFHLCL